VHTGIAADTVAAGTDAGIAVGIAADTDAEVAVGIAADTDADIAVDIAAEAVAEVAVGIAAEAVAEVAVGIAAPRDKDSAAVPDSGFHIRSAVFWNPEIPAAVEPMVGKAAVGRRGSAAFHTPFRIFGIGLRCPELGYRSLCNVS